MLERVIGTIQRYEMFAPGDTVVVAVSGGVDSMALLHLLVALRVQWHLTLHAAHLDHGLRPTSADDAAFVRTAAASLNVPATVRRADVRALAARGRRSIEDAGRAARYAFFAEVAAAAAARAVATGHTRDDQVETVLMRLWQGGPWEHLAGIPPVRALDGAAVVRPLREVSRADLVAFVRDAGASWREDPTNRDLRLLRNRIRHRLLPDLLRAHPGSSRALWDLGETARHVDARLHRQTAALAARLLISAEGLVRVDRRAFRDLPPIMRRRLLGAAIVEVAGTPHLPPRVVLERVARAAASGRVGVETPAGGVVVRVGYEHLEVAPGRPAVPAVEYALPVPGAVHAGAFGVVVTAEVLEGASPGPAPESREAWFDAAEVAAPLRVRAWRSGDRFAPRGMGGKKKVQDLFVDAKVPRWQRARVPLVTDAADRILWVVGHRVAEGGRITARTRRVLRLRAAPA